MATTSRNIQSSYAGFLNGYIAGNLTANSQELSFHSGKILSFLKDIKSEFGKWDLSSEHQKMIFDNYGTLNDLPTNQITNEYYQDLGDAINNLIECILIIRPEMPSTTIFILKKIVYHFLNIAKTTKSSSIIKMAKQIAEKMICRDS